MGTARESQFGQNVRQDTEEGGLFFIHWDQPQQAASITT